MPIKSFSLELKSLTAEGSFVGLASTYNEMDQGGDVVMPGAFARTLADGKSRPLLLDHRAPVGLVHLTDTPSGLAAQGQLTLAVQQAQDTYQLMKAGVLRGLSIGFQTVKEQFSGDVRQLLEVKLYEVSLCCFPMNESALVSSVKNLRHDRDEITAAAADLRQFYSRLRST